MTPRDWTIAAVTLLLVLATVALPVAMVAYLGASPDGLLLVAAVAAFWGKVVLDAVC